MRKPKFQEGDKVAHVKDGGVYEICSIERDKSKTIYSCKDVTPNGEPIWHEKKGGGVWVERFVNGFYGEIFKFNQSKLILIQKNNKDE
tara:strand:+ start:11289 stop:11552 length:264 start_codon:yes stop_codon:yes gene_type:complete